MQESIAAPAFQMKMKRGEFIALSACTMMLTALGIDVMLPVFGELRKHFGLPHDSTATAQIISFFFLGQVAQIIFGVLSDTYGRLSILRIGFPLYIVSGVAATFAPTLPLMLAARFLAGVGASAVFMTTIAAVRDRFVGDEMARIMSLVFTIFLFTPVLAPFIGIAVLSVSSWKWVFLTPPIFAVIIFLWSLRLEESHLPAQRSRLNWETIFSGIKKVLGNKTFLRYTTVTTLLFTSLSSYVASSEHIVGEIYNKPELFAWIFAGIGAFMACCTLVNSKLSALFGAKKSLRGLLIVYACVAGLLFVYTLLNGNPPNIIIFFSAIGILLGLNLAIEPNSSALALEPMGDNAGIASAVYGTYFFAIGSGIGSIISNQMKETVFPLVIGFFVLALVAIFLTMMDKHRK